MLPACNSCPRDPCTWPHLVILARGPCAAQLNSGSWVDWVPFQGFAKSATFLEQQRSVVSARDVSRDFFRSRWAFLLINLVCLPGWPFYTISLRVKSGRKPPFNAEEVVEQWLEFRDEKKASISDNGVQKPVVTYYHIYDNFSKPSCIKVDLDLFVVDRLCESIDND